MSGYVDRTPQQQRPVPHLHRRLARRCHPPLPHAGRADPSPARRGHRPAAQLPLRAGTREGDRTGHPAPQGLATAGRENDPRQSRLVMADELAVWLYGDHIATIDQERGRPWLTYTEAALDRYPLGTP